MTLLAFTDGDGYYQVEVHSGQNPPDWTNRMTPCAVMQVPFTQATKDAAIAKTYADVDAVYASAVGNREPEYREAEAAARAYISAGYTGAVSPYISGWAIAKGLTNAQSADAIIVKADALAAAKLALRNIRFTSQQSMQAATNQSELDTAVAAWDSFVITVRASL